MTTSELPESLQSEINRMVNKYPEIGGLINQLLSHFTNPQPRKKPRTENYGPALLCLPPLSFTLPIRKKESLSMHSDCYSVADFNVKYKGSKILMFQSVAKVKLNWTVVIFNVGSLQINDDPIIFQFDDKIPKFKLEKGNYRGTPKEIISKALLHSNSSKILTPVGKFGKTAGQLSCHRQAKEGSWIL